MQKRTALSVVIGCRWTDHLTVIGTEVRDYIVEEPGVLSPMHTKQTDERQLQTEKKTIGKQVQQIPCCPLAAEIEETKNGNGIVTATSSVILIDLTVAVGRRLPVTMTEKEEIERVSGKSSIVREEIPGEASMSCHMVMRDLVEAGDEELTVMWKVLIAPG